MEYNILFNRIRFGSYYSLLGSSDYLVSCIILCEAVERGCDCCNLILPDFFVALDIDSELTLY